MSRARVRAWANLLVLEQLYLRYISPHISCQDADSFLQLAADDGLYTNVAALLAGPPVNQQQQVQQMQMAPAAAPDASFAWSPCTYTLATSEVNPLPYPGRGP